jgi:hypothetical protein
MRRIFIALSLSIVFLTPGCQFIPHGFTIDHTTVNADAIPDSILASAKQLDVYFEHASVGGYIMDGMDALAAADPRYTYTRHSDSSSNDAPPTLGQLQGISTWFGANSGIADFMRGNPGPAPKVSYFVTSMATIGPAAPNVAMFKFCYIDNQAPALAKFESVRDTLESLTSQYPNITFIWWTMPVETTGDPVKEEYNNLIRNYCRAHEKVLFDIADIECHNPAGVKNTNGGYEALCSEYNLDGGHPNPVGAERRARALWCLLAGICGWN